MIIISQEEHLDVVADHIVRDRGGDENSIAAVAAGAVHQRLALVR